MAVARIRLQDQLLANVARKIQVDVGYRLQVLIEKAAEEQPVADRIDVRQTDQVTDDRADGRAATATRRQARATPHGTLAADAFGDVCRLLLQIAVDQEETCQLVFLDKLELVLELLPGPGSEVRVRLVRRVAFVEFARAE